MGILLSIAIPTYNRAPMLRLCLEQILKQAAPYSNELEVLVSDNNSTDDTEQLVRDVISHGHSITYIKNHENIGAERNVVQCFEKATGKYVLILGDDDLILDNGLPKIVEFLRGNEVGVFYLSAYGFKKDYIAEQPKKGQTGVEIFTEVEKYLEKVHYWVTFLSGNVVNKSLLPAQFDPTLHIGTNLPQVNWILKALFGARQNAILSDYTVAFKAENTGGYILCDVFGHNFKLIMDSFVAQGVPFCYFDEIKYRLLKDFFPDFILIARSGNSKYDFGLENYHAKLCPIYHDNLCYWFYTYPSIVLPLLFAKIYNRLHHLVSKVIYAINKQIF